MYKDDYKNAGLQMLPVVDNGVKRTVMHIFLNALILIPKKPINPKFIITAADSGTTAKIPHKILLKKNEASIPITNKEAKMLIKDDLTIMITKSLKTTIIPVTSILESLLKLFSI